MVSLPVSHRSPRPGAHANTSRVARMAAAIGDFFEILGAAIRVARAVESRHDPDRDDLRTLGIDRPLPKSGRRAGAILSHPDSQAGASAGAFTGRSAV